jgi:hypothetical protein
MSRTELCSSLYDELISRFASERQGLVVSGLFAERLYLSIMTVLERDGEVAARRYVKEAKLR